MHLVKRHLYFAFLFSPHPIPKSLVVHRTLPYSWFLQTPWRSHGQQSKGLRCTRRQQHRLLTLSTVMTHRQCAHCQIWRATQLILWQSHHAVSYEDATAPVHPTHVRQVLTGQQKQDIPWQLVRFRGACGWISLDSQAISVTDIRSIDLLTWL